MITEHVSTLETLARQFASPQKEFSPVPIWWWSGDRLERTRLRWQMEQLIAGGIYNVIILDLAPTGPLYGSDPDQPRFMSEEWWDIFLGVCEDARQLGMRLWFYDQIGFSGANLQGEIVRHEPSYAGQALTSITVEGEGALELECPSEGTPLAAAYTPLDDSGNPAGEPVAVPLNGRTARADAPENKRLRLMYAIPRGFDYYNSDACARLLDIVHHEFERRAGQFFGDVIVGSFQDELPSLLSWSVRFADAFQEIKGYDLRERLAALWEGEDANSRQVRVDYHEVRALLAERAFFVPLFEWHRRHGLICGFDQQGPARSGEPIGGVRLYADYLRTHRWYDAPGSDHHGDAKIHSSLAHLYDRPRVWIESFHSSGWGGTLEETFDWLLPWLRAGATLYNPHAVYYSTWGGWWEWAPPSTCWRQPYWRHYSIFASTISRLCFLLSQGTHVCDIGVLYPTTTIQSGLTVDGALSSAQAANDAYQALTGSMMFLQMEPGVLDRERRDFDVLDDASVQRGVVENGALRIGAEGYRAILLPACTVLEGATARQLTDFVSAGGLLIAVGTLPEQIAGELSGDLEKLRALFDAGQAVFVADAEDVPSALARIPRCIDAPVPTLHRRIDGADVLFVPAAYPHATTSDLDNAHWLRADYEFDPARYQRPMKVRVSGFSGTPQLWDAVTGERRAVTVTRNGDADEVEIPFDSAPAALLVWEQVAASVPSKESGAPSLLLELPDQWSATLEPTLDNRYGDLTKPDFQGSPPVQTWHFSHRIERADEDGLSDHWYDGVSQNRWMSIVATFGTYGWWIGVQPADRLPAPLSGLDGSGDLQVGGWKPANYSLQRGIYKDLLHVPTLGPKGHVPEEFLTFGSAASGEGVQFRTTVWMDAETEAHLALAAPAHKQAWVNGQALGEETPGYLWLTPIHLKAGRNLLEWRLTAERDDELRAYWALVTEAAAFARPERMIPGDRPRKDSRLLYSLDFDVPFVPAASIFQISADSPCRLLVNGVEAGRQGGFDPYASLARVQPYTVSNLRQGANTVVVELQDIGSRDPVNAADNLQAINGHAAVTVDGLVSGAGGETQAVVSGRHWQVRRDDGDAQPVHLYRSQWLDPAWSHLWRRPHPLPEAAWLDGTPSRGVVVPVVPDAHAAEARVEWFRWVLPPGAVEMCLPLAGQARLWVDGGEIPVEGETVPIPPSDRVNRSVYLRVEPLHGRTGGGVFLGPVTYRTGAGLIRLGDWGEQGLHAYSGGVRYQTTFTIDALPEGSVHLDLGRVRGTAEAWLNGHCLGARVWSPYRFDMTPAVRAGENTLEVLVLNTLAPYLEAVSPTHYVRPGQTVSGLMGPARVYLE
jgi:hypothetical protein